MIQFSSLQRLHISFSFLAPGNTMQLSSAYWYNSALYSVCIFNTAI